MLSTGRAVAFRGFADRGGVRRVIDAERTRLVARDVRVNPRHPELGIARADALQGAVAVLVRDDIEALGKVRWIMKQGMGVSWQSVGSDQMGSRGRRVPLPAGGRAGVGYSIPSSRVAAPYLCTASGWAASAEATGIRGEPVRAARSAPTAAASCAASMARSIESFTHCPVVHGGAACRGRRAACKTSRRGV